MWVSGLTQTLSEGEGFEEFLLIDVFSIVGVRL
jgi:hypothetical protein